jgi:hypothetical protein
MFEEWMNADSDFKLVDRYRLISDFESIKVEYSQTGRHLFGNFLKTAELI